MIQRFHIEDLIGQDRTGVVFRAFDTETGQIVALRRFFPFGPEGGGLNSEEQAAYNIAIGKLARLSHPALRSLVCGGCDPVDGMPYIATEWIDGVALGSLIERKPLNAELATELVTRALEVCELLSRELDEQAVWVETEPYSIIFEKDGAERRFTFWISPMKWLGTGGGSRGLESIIALTEQVMGWKGRKLNANAGHGLGDWLTWLRANVAGTSLREARKRLTASVNAGAATPTIRPTLHLTPAAAKPPVIAAPKKTGPSFTLTAMFWVNVVLFLACFGLGGWWWFYKRGEKPHRPDSKPDNGVVESPAPAVVPLSNLAVAPKAGPSEEELRLRANQLAKESIASRKPAQPAAKTTEAPGTVIQWTDHAQLVQNNGKEVVVEGVFLYIEPNLRGKTMYLHFSKKPDRNDARGAIQIRGAPRDLSQQALQPLIGKKIRLRGKVEVQRIVGLERPDIRILNRASIQLVP